MFSHQVSSFGRFEKHTLANAEGDQQLSVVPGKGACLLELTLGGQSVIAGFETPEALDNNSGARSMPLFPFPSRLQGGRFEWQGQEYHFPLTDKSGPNAIHGFGRHTDMPIAQLVLEQRQASITCTYEDDGTLESYPFPFRFSMAYRIGEDASMELEMAFTNLHSSSIPAGFGWHPYFRLTPLADELLLQMPPWEEVVLDSYLIPTGERRNFEDFASPAPVGKRSLNACFALTQIGTPAKAALLGGGRRLDYWQETGPGKFNFMVLYIPDDRRSIAVEPMTCNANAFNNRDGLIELAPGETARATCGLRIS